MSWISDNEDTISSIADLAQVLIAAISILLAWYIFVHQRNRDNDSDAQNQREKDQAIELQWFRVLIIEPRLQYLEGFFTELEKYLKEKSLSDNFSEEQIIEINRGVNDRAAQFRTRFYDSIISIDGTLYKSIKSKSEDLVSLLTKVYSDNELKLSKDAIFFREISTPIRKTEADIIGLIYKHKGT